MLRGSSRDRLGESMGLTLQQVQKYEKGVNRVGASRLFQISKILDVPVQFFFEEAPNIGGDGTPVRGMAEPDSEAFILEFLNNLNAVLKQKGCRCRAAFKIKEGDLVQNTKFSDIGIFIIAHFNIIHA